MRRLVVGDADRGAHDLTESPERNAAPIGEAAPLQDSGVAGDSPDELLRQARLADARLGQHRHRPRRLLRDGLRVGGLEPVELRVPADEDAAVRTFLLAELLHRQEPIRRYLL